MTRDKTIDRREDIKEGTNTFYKYNMQDLQI